jgi:hypothetical protein
LLVTGLVSLLHVFRLTPTAPGEPGPTRKNGFVCELHQNGEAEGSLGLNRLPTAEEAEVKSSARCWFSKTPTSSFHGFQKVANTEGV